MATSALARTLEHVVLIEHRLCTWSIIYSGDAYLLFDTRSEYFLAVLAKNTDGDLNG